ncbi:AmmeMemoRadiSam system protein B [candidate division KSB1 bacterium]|nr:AmmeMemoRadiSam system protein B [candidate division KSB1 bacterium]
MSDTITRHIYWADQFYPEDPEKLNSMIKSFLDAAPETDLFGEIFGLVVPHAGYVYSGKTAAAAYKLLCEKNYQTVVVIGPSHATSFPGVSVFNGDYYDSAFGPISIDKNMTRALAEIDPVIRLSEDGHLPSAYHERAEHSLEVQLPFLQKVLKNEFQLVPVVFHDYSLNVCETLARALAAQFRVGETLIVASSDLYHGQNYDECIRMDDVTVDKICSMDSRGFNEGILKGRYQACGGGPIAALLGAASAFSGARAQVLSRINSADVVGVRRGYVVGYASIVVTVDRG